MVLYSRKEECYGCSACKSICPQSAVQMLPDNEGFLYPVIDENLCTNCGLCAKVCSFKNNCITGLNFKVPLVFAVRHRDINEIVHSQSGAMFVAISDYILKNNGVVYGVGYTDHFRAVHKRAATNLERDEFRGSKYVQSDINETYKSIKNDLKDGLLVLFSGTPCQSAGLKSYLEGYNTDNLIICDIICYGTSSPKIWNDYLQYIEKKYADIIVEVNFRDKEMGWKSQYETFEFLRKKGKVIRESFKVLFTSNIILRPSCGICKFTNILRNSDITIGDYWGIERLSTSINYDNTGVSLVLINTEKGECLFNKLKNDIVYLESNVEKCLQNKLQKPSKASLLRDRFWNDYDKHGFKYVGRKYSNLGQNIILHKINRFFFKKIWNKLIKI